MGYKNVCFDCRKAFNQGTDLINIRGQGQYFRPFTLVKEMQREAESKFQAVEQQLRQRLQQIEAQLAELQNQH